NLRRNRIRAEGAKALAVLTGLTSLTLESNEIGLLNVPPRIDKVTAIAHIEAVRDAAQADGVGMFGSVGVVLPESFEMRVRVPPDIAAGLRDLCHIANGIQCGATFIYDGRRILAQETVFTILLPEGPLRWQDFAMLDDVPVFIDRTDGSIWHSRAATFHGIGE